MAVEFWIGTEFEHKHEQRALVRFLYDMKRRLDGGRPGGDMRQGLVRDNQLLWTGPSSALLLAEAVDRT